jgi:hypothetical protein
MDRRKFIENATKVALGAAVLAPVLSGCSDNSLTESSTTEIEKKSQKEAKLAGIVIPQIMDWTIIPKSVIASCWLSNIYKQNFVSAPTTVLQSVITNLPTTISFTARENTTTIRTLPLPYLKSGLTHLTRAQIRNILSTEIGSDDLEFMLPASVIEEAFFNSTYKSLLLSDANSALQQKGYSTGSYTYQVSENTSTNYNLSIPVAPSNISTLSQSQAEALLLARFSGETTKCCASGTCDNDTP